MTGVTGVLPHITSNSKKAKDMGKSTCAIKKIHVDVTPVLGVARTCLGAGQRDALYQCLPFSNRTLIEDHKL